MDKLIITPRTKIYDLLEDYPELEETLIAAAPQFKKLTNPILRKTVTRITSLSQAATIGEIKVEELVNTLRQKVGQVNVDHSGDTGHSYNTERPDWFHADSVKNTIDISDMLNAGEQPVHEVLSAIKKLNPGEILEIKAPFIPAPLIDKSLSLNYKHWLIKQSDEDYLVFFAP